MKKHLFKFALTLFVCMLSNAALADEDPNFLINEDFSTLPKGYSQSFNDWILRGGRDGNPGNGTNVLLKVEDYQNAAGYATTPALNYSGNVLLSFRYGTNKNSSSFSISLGSNMGTFADNSSSKEVTITYRTDGNLFNANYIITGVKTDTKIKFQQKTTSDYFYLDDVKVIKLGEITLNEENNSSDAIKANNETSCTVKTERTLNADKWNTLCLPFDVNMSVLETALGTDKEIELRTYSSYDAFNKVMNFEVADNATIEAATPFLIKLNTTVENPAFTGVTIKNVAAKTIESNGVSFVGTYSPVELNTDGTHIFITTDNKIAKPLEGKNEMKGLRAYITVPSDFDFNDARLFLDDEATAINSIGTKKATNSATLFNLQGQRVKHPRSGLYIKNNKLTIIR